MKEVTRYQCEICGALYEKEEAAYHCSHLFPTGVKGFSFTEGLAFPEYIKIGFTHKGTDLYQTYRLEMLANASKKGNYFEANSK